MLRRKLVLLSALYLGLAAGIPVFLVLVISQSYPIFNSSAASSGWKVRSQILVLQPEGMLILPPASAFVAYKGPITLLSYPRLDSAGLQSQLFSEGKTFVTLSGRRYSIINREAGSVTVILTQVIAPTSINDPTPTPRPGLDRGYNLQLLEDRYVPVPPNNDALEEFVLLQRENLLKKGKP